MPDESAKIILAATHGKLTKVRDCLLIEDSINSIQCQFEFRTSDWNNTSKTAVFVRGWATTSTPSADMIIVMLDENNTCNVPYEVLNKGSSFSVGVFGSSDGYRIVSNWMYYKIKDGCFSEGSSPIDPSSTVYEQILEALSKKSNVGHTHNEIKANADAIIAEKNRAEGAENNLRGNIDEIKNELDAYAKKSDIEELIPDNIATNEYVDKKVSDLVSSAPEALDTLQELSKALGDDPHFATTVAAELGNKVDKIEGKGLSTNDYTDEEKAKLASISEGADKAIQSDWNQNDNTAKDYIKNKPTIATDNEVIDMLIEADMLCAVSDFDGSLLTDENSHILLY